MTSRASLPVFGPDAPLLDRLRTVSDRILDQIEAWFGRALVQDAAIVLVIIALLTFSLMHGFDLSLLTNGDVLYPVHVQYFPLFDYQAPPSSGWFPDVLVHLAIAPLFPEPLAQKIVAGWILFIASVVAVGAFKNRAVAWLMIAIFTITGFGFVDSTSHYTLPVMILMVQLARPRWLKALVILLVVSSDILILLPLSVMLLERGEERYLPERLLAVALGVGWEAVYGEVWQADIELAAALVLFLAPVVIARKLGFSRLLCWGVAAALIAISVLGLAGHFSPARYTLPVAAAFVMLLAPTRRPRFNWRLLAVPAAMLAVFSASADDHQQLAFAREYDCLLDVLEARDIHTIAADHWTAKPIFFAAKARDYPLTITQVDFERNINFNGLAPYENFGLPTRYAFRSNKMCGFIEPGTFAMHCERDRIGEVVARELLCESAELFTYAEAIPRTYVTPPSGKLEALQRRFDKAVVKLGVLFGAPGAAAADKGL
ncbi:MAG: hypothetical protein KKH72_03290 [Alphaproteobacteria bacterium]|nr:hypothetical protein [Alphaproteobacteria bacterium]